MRVDDDQCPHLSFQTLQSLRNDSSSLKIFLGQITRFGQTFQPPIPNGSPVSGHIGVTSSYVIKSMSQGAIHKKAGSNHVALLAFLEIKKIFTFIFLFKPNIIIREVLM